MDKQTIDEIRMKTTLLPCPFCGGNAKQSHVNIRYMVFCEDCCIGTTAYSTPNKAIEAWNRRIELPTNEERTNEN